MMWYLKNGYEMKKKDFKNLHAVDLDASWRVFELGVDFSKKLML